MPHGGDHPRHDHGHDHPHGHDDASGHGHAHAGHAHGPGHHHGPARYDRAFAVGVGLNLALVVAEVVVGLVAGSLALVADAGHNLGDVLGLVLAWAAAVATRWPPTRRRTYGFGRSSILASLINAVVLLIGVGAIVVEAVRRFTDPHPVAGLPVMAVAAAAILVNAFTAWLFMGGERDINVRGAFLHMAADAVVSLGVVIAAGLIRFTGWLWLDPLTSLVIAAVITWGTWGLLRDSLDMAMDAVPPGVDRAEVESYLRTLPGVVEVHDLHIWSLSTTMTALTAHLVRPEAAGLDDHLLAEACAGLRRRFGIGHATLQIEGGDPAHPCGLAPADVI